MRPHWLVSVESIAEDTKEPRLCDVGRWWKCRNKLTKFSINITYLPHKAVAEVSNHSEPIGKKYGFQLVRKSIPFRLSDSIVLNFNIFN